MNDEHETKGRRKRQKTQSSPLPHVDPRHPYSAVVVVIPKEPFARRRPIVFLGHHFPSIIQAQRRNEFQPVMLALRAKYAIRPLLHKPRRHTR
jgi:hypothetical protein